MRGVVLSTVAILTLAPGLALAAGSRVEPPPPVRLTMAATTERIPLTGLHGRVELSVDALSRTIRVRPVAVKDVAKDAPAGLAARIAAHVGLVCPHVTVRDGAVELTCRSRRIDAQISVEGKTQYLDINELRGLPWRAGPDGAPGYFFDPWRIGLGQGCPARTGAARGECELKDGRLLEAARSFRGALDTTNRQMASIRLGDIAMQTGDPVTAGGWYRRVGPFGVFGRVAAGRLCELDGKCLANTDEVLRTFDPSGQPEPLRAESLMRAARAEAYAGRIPAAVHIIAAQVRAHGMASICREGGAALCRRILYEALRAAGAKDGACAPALRPAVATGTGTGTAGAVATDDQRAADERAYLEELMETYLATPSWEKGPLAVEMAQAAASVAVRLGAPGFGGNLLSALAPEVPAGQLSEHLLLGAETYLCGQDWARARVISEYARSRLGARGRNGARWKAVTKALVNHAEEDDIPPAVRAAMEAEMEAALTELKNARAARDRVKGLLRGARDAEAIKEATSATTLSRLEPKR